MSRSISDSLPLARSSVDRDYRSRDDPAVLDRPDVRFLVLRTGAALLTATGRLALVPGSALPETLVRIYLGRSTGAEREVPVGTPLAAAVIDPSAPVDGLLDGLATFAGFGSLVGSLVGSVPDCDAGLLAEALAMANWHAMHGFSPRTGEPTAAVKAGWVRVGPDGHELFPRTDPAVIVGITDAADRLLLGSNAAWEPDRYSLLAGFVEPGESLEAAVVREVEEEAGIRVVDPVYLGSQPWPFPASIMLGFRASLAPGSPEVRPDGEEIVDLRWFSREELGASLDEVRLPGRSSIARAIIEDWFGGTIADGR